MVPYFLSYALISFLAILEFYKIKIFINNKNKINFFVILYLCLFMGFKYHVGGDWGTYKNYFNGISNNKIKFADLNTDIGYYFLNLLIHKLGLEFKFVNLVSSIISLLGLHLLAKNFSRYWFFLLILKPFFIFIILMGYTRQSISIGFLFIAISFLLQDINKKNIYFYLTFIIFAFLFHKSSFIFLLVPLLFLKSNLFTYSVFMYFYFFILLIFLILHDRFIERLEYFFSNQYSSFGGYLKFLLFLFFVYLI